MLGAKSRANWVPSMARVLGCWVCVHAGATVASVENLRDGENGAFICGLRQQTIIYESMNWS